MRNLVLVITGVLLTAGILAAQQRVDSKYKFIAFQITIPDTFPVCIATTADSSMRCIPFKEVRAAILDHGIVCPTQQPEMCVSAWSVLPAGPTPR